MWSEGHFKHFKGRGSQVIIIIIIAIIVLRNVFRRLFTPMSVFESAKALNSFEHAPIRFPSLLFHNIIITIIITI